MTKPFDLNHIADWVNDCQGEDCKGCDSPECFSKGGMVLKNKLTASDDNTNSSPIYSTQRSASGQDYKPSSGYGHDWISNAKGGYSMDDYSDPPKSKMATANYDKGGEVEGSGDDEAMDAELQDMCAGELLDAIQSKDKAGILEAIRAIVLSVR